MNRVRQAGLSRVRTRNESQTDVVEWRRILMHDELHQVSEGWLRTRSLGDNVTAGVQ